MRWRVGRIGASGVRRSRLLRGRELHLAPRGFGNREIAFAPGRRGVHASARRPRPSFPETSRTSTGIRRGLAHGPLNRSTLKRISNRKIFGKVRRNRHPNGKDQR